jgi:hypothetical protein
VVAVAFAERVLSVLALCPCGRVRPLIAIRVRKLHIQACLF